MEECFVDRYEGDVDDDDGDRCSGLQDRCNGGSDQFPADSTSEFLLEARFLSLFVFGGCFVRRMGNLKAWGKLTWRDALDEVAYGHQYGRVRPYRWSLSLRKPLLREFSSPCGSQQGVHSYGRLLMLRIIIFLSKYRQTALFGFSPLFLTSHIHQHKRSALAR